MSSCRPPCAAVTAIKVVRIEATTETPSEDDPNRFLKLAEVAALFQISRSTAYRLKKDQGWPSHRFGTEIGSPRKTSKRLRR